jgi:hypothetical protein
VLFAIILAVCMAIAAGGTAWAYNYNNTRDLSWYLNNPEAAEFTISTGGQLHAFSALVNGEATDQDGQSLPAVDFAEKTVKLASGLNLFDYEFTPIGTADHPFAGIFDGQGSAISRLKITTPVHGAGNVGLFGVTSATATITGVSLSQNSNIILQSADPAVRFDNVGGIVGNNGGTVTNCSSAARLAITHTATDGLTAPVATNIGGVVGGSTGVISNVSHAGKLEIITPANAFADPTNAENILSWVVYNVGGVVGNTTADISGADNSGTLYVITSGTAGTDRFGSPVDSKSCSVGGVVGNSVANISSSANSGRLFTSANPVDPNNPQASFDGLGNEEKLSAVKQSDGGADGIGGIVGTLRATPLSGMNTSGSDAGMADGAPLLTITDCSNTGFINGLHAVGGIVGTAGTNTTITRCVNGVAGDLQTGHVRSTRWNKAATGGIAGQSFGTVSYSRNHAQVENTKTGYYTAGIVGMLLKWDTQPKRSEILSCYNTGNIYCGGATASFREGGIVGENNGYVHDNVFLFGTVSTHIANRDDAASAAAGLNYGVVHNTTVAYETRRQADAADGIWIKSGEAVAILNTLSATNDWRDYYFISSAANNGYPILNNEAPPEGALDLSKVAVLISLESHASYTAARNPTPKLKVSITVDGTTATLIEGADFKVVADPSALDENGICKGITSGAAPYFATIEGIGNHYGSPSTKTAYGINKGNFAECTVSAAEASWTGEAQNNPVVTVLDAAGGIVAPEDYDVVVNDVDGDGIGADCIEVAHYPLRATAKEASNYSGTAQGSYDIIKANLYSDCDVIGIYLGTSVWFFDEEVSKIYEVTPILDDEGALTYSQQDEASYDIAGIMKVEGFSYYQTDDGRTLTRATPQRTDASGKPVYNDWEFNYTGVPIEPDVIGVLQGDSLLTGVSINDPSHNDAEYIWNWGYFSDRAPREAPRNTNATFNEAQPEASIIVQGGKHFSNYVYMDFKIRPIQISADNLFVVQRTTTLPYSGDALPKTPGPSAVITELGQHKAVEVRYASEPSEYDPDDPTTYTMLSHQNYELVFEYATTVDDAPITDGVYTSGSKVYYKILIAQDTQRTPSLQGWQEKAIPDPWVIETSQDNKMVLGDVAEAVFGTGTGEPSDDPVYDATKDIYENLRANVTVTNVMTNTTLVQGRSATAANADYYMLSGTKNPNNPNSKGISTPVYNPNTDRLEGVFAVTGTNTGQYFNYSTTYPERGIEIPYSFKRGEVPTATSEAFTDQIYGLYFWSFNSVSATETTQLRARPSGYTKHELSELINLLNWSSTTTTAAIPERSFTVVDIMLDDQSVDKVLEVGKPYVLKVELNPDDSEFFSGSADPYYYVPVRVVKTGIDTSLATYARQGIWVVSTATMEPASYMYTGNDIKPTVVVRDQNGEPYRADEFLLLAVPQPLSARGRVLEPGQYNAETGSDNYTDLLLTGSADSAYFSHNSTVIGSNGRLNTSGKLYRQAIYDTNPTTASPGIDLSFEIVAADISDPSKVQIVVDEAFYNNGQPLEPSVSFYDTSGNLLNYQEGSAGDYTLSYRNNTSVGTATAIITVQNSTHLTSEFVDSESGKPYVEVSFEIQGEGLSVADATIEWDYTETIVVLNDGTLSEPGVLGSHQGAALALDAYALVTGVYANEIFTEKTTGWKTGDSVYLQVTGIKDGVLSGVKILGPLTAKAPDDTNDFTRITALTVTAGDTVFTGAPAKPSIVVVVGSSLLVEDRDYSVTCAEVNVSTGATVSVVGKGAYTGLATGTFSIMPANLADVEATITAQIYTGTQIKPEADAVTRAKLGDYELVPGDWMLDSYGYGDNLDVAQGGTLKLLPGLSGNFSGTCEAGFAITPMLLTKDVIIIEVEDDGLAYTGSGVALDASNLKVNRGMEELEFGSDYIIAGYANNVNAGTATVYLSGAGNYSADSTVSASFTIALLDFSAVAIEGIEESYEHNGGTVRPAPTVKIGDVVLPASDYSVSYGANDTFGTTSGTLTVTPISASITDNPRHMTFAITADLARAQVEALPNATFERGGSYEPNLKVAFNGVELVEGTHYTVGYDTYSAGEKTLVIVGVAPLTGRYEASYSIYGRPLSEAGLALIAEQSFTGEALTPAVSLADGHYTLIEGTDYEVSYLNNINATSTDSKAIAMIVGRGDYSGILSQPFVIAARTLDETAAEAAVKSVIPVGKFTGSGTVEAKVVIEDAQRMVGTGADAVPYQLVEGRDYEVAYSNNNKAGTATATITGTGNYDFTVTRSYTIETATAPPPDNNTGGGGSAGGSNATSGGSNGNSTINNYYGNYGSSSSGQQNNSTDTASRQTDTSDGNQTAQTQPRSGTGTNATTENNSSPSTTTAEPETPQTAGSVAGVDEATPSGFSIWWAIAGGLAIALVAGVFATLYLRERKLRQELEYRQ